MAALPVLRRGCASVVARLEIDGGIFAATVDLKLELETVAFVERGQASTLDSADVNERIGLSIVALNEAETLHRVEELDRPARTLAGQLALRSTIAATRAARTGSTTGTLGNGKRITFDNEVAGRNLAAAIHESELQRLAFSKAGQASLLDGADVDEHVLSTSILNDEAKALLAVEELDDARAFANDLRRHPAATAAAATAAKAAATTAATAKAAATTTAAAAESATVTTAEAATVSAEATATESATITAETTAAKAATVATAEAAAIGIVTEAIALVLAATAASSIETHALLDALVRP